MKLRARQTFDRFKSVEHPVRRGRRVLVEHDSARQVSVDACGVVLVGRPVPARHAGHLAPARAADHDVIAAFGDELVEAAVAKEDVVAIDLVLRENLVEVVARRAVEGAGLDPVVSFVAQNTLGVLAAENEVVAFAGEHFRARIGAENDEVGACAAHDQVEARTAMHDVVAGAGLDVVIAAEVPDDVVAVTGVDDVVAGAAFEIVIAAVAEERVVAFAGDEDVVPGGLKALPGLVPPSTTCWSPVYFR